MADLELLLGAVQTVFGSYYMSDEVLESLDVIYSRYIQVFVFLLFLMFGQSTLTTFSSCMEYQEEYEDESPEDPPLNEVFEVVSQS